MRWPTSSIARSCGTRKKPTASGTRPPPNARRASNPTRRTARARFVRRLAARIWQDPHPMNHIGPLLLEANILLEAETATKKRLFERVAELFEQHAHLSRSVVFDSLTARERLGSTGL